MLWRDWVEELKDMGESLVSAIHGDRPLTPFFMVATDEETDGYPLHAEHFKTEDATDGLVEFMLPLAREFGATRCAWLLNATAKYLRADESVTMPESLILAAFDREVEETWVAPIYRFDEGPAMLGVWMAWPPNATTSQLVGRMQQALR